MPQKLLHFVDMFIKGTDMRFLNTNIIFFKVKHFTDSQNIQYLELYLKICICHENFGTRLNIYIPLKC